MILDPVPIGPERTVGIVGYGAIGRVLADELGRGRAGLRLGGVMGSRAPNDLRVATVEDLIGRCDVIVEAAGQPAVRAYAERILTSGRDLLLLSVGALADDDLATRLAALEGGRLIISTGALGGVDLLRAAALSGRLREVRVVTRKPATALVSETASREVRRHVDAGRAVTVFRGSARMVAREYPSSTNIAATVALCTLGLDQVEVELIADPQAVLVSHRVTAQGDIGQYAFEITNHPSENPRTSAITPYAALRALLYEHSRVAVR